MSTTEAKVVLSVVDRITAPITAIQRRIDRITEPVRRVGRALSDIGRAAGVDKLAGSVTNLGRRLGEVGSVARNVVAPLAAIGGLAAGLGARSLLATNMEFEKYASVLEAVLKSSTRAKEAMAWVSDFAAKTPYEIGEVTDAFVKLTTYGFAPTSGALKAAGEAAAAMGKPLSEAVEALADAVTGENERLKAFSIRAEAAGDKIKYSWVENGKEMTAFAKKNSRAQIEAVITGIWNRQYAGAMDKLSRTMGGMFGNLKDQWARFMLAIGNAGSFDYMKGRLSALLDYVNGLAASGRLAAIGKRISDDLVSGMKAIEDWARALNWSAMWEGFKAGLKVLGVVAGYMAWIGSLLGPSGSVFAGLAALGAITFGPLIMALGSLVGAIGSVASAVLFTPAGLAALIIAGGVIGIMARKSEAFARVWELLPTKVQNALSALRPIADFVDWLTDGLAAGLGKVTEFVDGLTDKLAGFLKSATSLFDWAGVGVPDKVTAPADEAKARAEMLSRPWGPKTVTPHVSPSARLYGPQPSPQGPATRPSSPWAQDRGAAAPAPTVPIVTQETNNVSAPLTVNAPISVSVPTADLAAVIAREVSKALSAAVAQQRAAALSAFTD